jgi:hypothetical protein
MRCGKCGKDNREGRRFCAECGAALAVKCARCGASNVPDENFCGDCGAAFAAGNPTAPAANAQAPAPGGMAPAISIAMEPTAGEVPEGERKTVTALFADIKGSMELMEDLDPEEARANRGVNLQVRVGVNMGEVVVRSIQTEGALGIHTDWPFHRLGGAAADTGEFGAR